MRSEKVKVRDGSGYQATRNKSRSIEMSRTSTESPGHTVDYLDSAILRKRAKKRKGLVRSGWLLVSCCRLADLALKMDEAARYEILSKRSSGH